MNFEKTSNQTVRVSLSGAGLKWIAIICMLLDHIGAVLVEPICMGQYVNTSLTPNQWTTIYYVLRCIGRIAFPIFAFLIVEGFLHTSNRAKYLRNLCIFAIVSELPFNLAISKQLFTLEYQNVFFTLALGLVALMAMEYIVLQVQTKGYSPIVQMLLTVAAVALIAVAAEFTRTDYGAIGVVTIAILYQYRQNKVSGSTIAWIVLSLYNLIEIFCFPFIIAVKYYNGQRGRQNKILFYVFYPLHLLVLVGISKLICS